MTEYVDKLLQQHQELLESASVNLKRYETSCFPKHVIIKWVCQDAEYTSLLNGFCGISIFAYYPIIDIVSLDLWLDEISGNDAADIHEYILKQLNNNRRNNK